jgi:hypothetical protein
MYVSIIDIDDIPGMQHSYASKFRLGLKQSILQDYEKKKSIPNFQNRARTNQQTNKTKIDTERGVWRDRGER